MIVQISMPITSSLLIFNAIYSAVHYKIGYFLIAPACVRFRRAVGNELYCVMAAVVGVQLSYIGCRLEECSRRHQQLELDWHSRRHSHVSFDPVLHSDGKNHLYVTTAGKSVDIYILKMWFLQKRARPRKACIQTNTSCAVNRTWPVTCFV